MLHLESRLQESKKRRASGRTPRQELQYHLRCGEVTDEAHLRMFARLLSYNAGLVDPQYAADMQSHWNGISRDVSKETRISFFVPCLRLRWRALEELETGLPVEILGASCRVCGKGGETSLCGGCKSVHYCPDADCQQTDWSRHKNECKVSKRLLADPASFPPNKFYVSARTYVPFVPESGFAIEQEAVKYGGTTNVLDCTRNEYGNDRFIVCTLMPNTYGHGDSGDRFLGQTVFLSDRRRSLCLRTGPGDPVIAKERNLGHPIPFHPEGFKQYKKVIASRGFAGQILYLWARRVGDCLELDLEDIPNQDVDWKAMC